MIKVIPSHGFQFDAPIIQLIKIGSKGLIGQDYQMLVKRANEEIAHAAKSIEWLPGEVPIHLIAIGSYEYYGPNKNGDAFSEETCKKYHHTFVKHARFFRNHINKDKKKSYGIVKASFYNDKMKRIELLVALNGNQEAAKRNNGIIADRELEKLAKDEDIGVSMACKVAYDVCYACKNKSRNRSEYCLGIDEGGKCPGGGLKHRMGMVLEDGSIVFAYNPEPIFFDISHVHRPADRIAYVTGQLKAASYEIDLTVEQELEEPVWLYLQTENTDCQQVYKAAYDIAEHETTLLYRQDNYPTTNYIFIPSILSENYLPVIKIAEHPENWDILYQHQLILPWSIFAKDQTTYLLGLRHLPLLHNKIYRQKAALEKISSILQTTQAITKSAYDHTIPKSTVEDFSLHPRYCLRRSYQYSVITPPVQHKITIDNNLKLSLESDLIKYSAYQIGLLKSLEFHPLYAELIARFNWMQAYYGNRTLPK